MNVYERQVCLAISKVKLATKWYDGFYLSDAVAAANCIYVEQTERGSEAQTPALKSFLEIISNLHASTVNGYVKSVGRAIIHELKHTNFSSNENYQTFAEDLLRYYSDFTNYVIYIADPTSRSVRDNPDKQAAINALNRRKTALSILILTCVCGACLLLSQLWPILLG